MDRHEREALEAAGFRVGTAAEFLGMDDADRKLVEFRLAIVRAVYRLRTAQNLSQQALAERIGSSQPRVARIEAGAPGVSLDLAAKALFALGGGLDDLRPPPPDTHAPCKAGPHPKRTRASKTAG